MSTTGLNLNGLNATTATSGNGIDVTAVVNQILDAERAPEKLWQQQQTDSQAESSALNTIKSSLSTLTDKVRNLDDFLGVLTSKTAVSSQTTVLTADAQTSATNGTHLVVVDRLATTGTAYSDPVLDPSATLAAGTISLQIGTVTHDIQVDGASTLAGLAASINQQNLGVSASVVSDISGSRLALLSTASGKGGDLTITGNTSGLTMHKGAAGQNASLTIDGVPVESATNTVTGALAGVTLHLSGSAPGSEISLTVGADTAGSTQAINDFVSAYNSVITAINNQFTFNTSTNQAGPLAGDSCLRSLQSSLLSDATYSIKGNGGLVNLASLGIDMNNDGTLSVNSTKLASVMSNQFSSLQNFFQSATNGFALHFASSLTDLTDPTKGILNLDLAQHASEQKTLTDEIAAFEDRLTARQKQLTTEYSQVDAALRQFPTIMQQIEAQLASTSTKS